MYNIYIYVCYVSVTIQIQMQNLTQLLHFRPDGLLRCNEHRGPQRTVHEKSVLRMEWDVVRWIGDPLKRHRICEAANRNFSLDSLTFLFFCVARHFALILIIFIGNMRQILLTDSLCLPKSPNWHLGFEHTYWSISNECKWFTVILANWFDQTLKRASRPASMACQGQDCPVGRWTDSEGLSECAFCPAGRIGLQAPGYGWSHASLEGIFAWELYKCSPGRLRLKPT